jgi:hypothetical protein
MKLKKTSRKTKRANAGSLRRLVRHYTADYIKQIEAAAMKQIKNATEVLHIKPRAYCIAKPAACCAVFVTPPQDAVPMLRNTQNATAETCYENVTQCEVGKWYVLAYVCTPGCSQNHVINMPNAKAQPRDL